MTEQEQRAQSEQSPRLAPVEQIHDGLPRHDNEAEMCALGSAMLSADAATRVVEELRVADFARNQHQLIYEAIKSLSDRADEITPFTVRRELEGQKNVRGDRVALYLHDLIERVPTPAFVGRYIDTLRGISPLRGMSQVGPQLVDIGERTDPADVEAAVEHAQKLLDDATRVAAPSSVDTVASMVTGFMDSLQQDADPVQGVVPTGWADLDRMLGGFKPGNLIVLAGRPGTGKSVGLANIAHHVGVTLARPVWVGTLEMSAQEYMARIVAHDAGVDGDRMRERQLTETDWQRFSHSTSRLLEATTFEIDDASTGEITVGRIRARARSMRRNGTPPAIILIDYLQLMRLGGKVENRQVEVSTITGSLKQLAKELHVPVVVAAQLNRGPEQRTDKRPLVSDLRESGSIEQDADVVMLLHRDDVYEKESPRAGEIDFIVGKNRHGPTGTITMVFQGHYSRIADMAPASWSPSGVLR